MKLFINLNKQTIYEKSRGHRFVSITSNASGLRDYGDTWLNLD